MNVDIVVVVMVVKSEYQNAIEMIESDIWEMTAKQHFTITVDDISTLDTVAEEWATNVMNHPSWPGGRELFIMLTLSDALEPYHETLLTAFRAAGSDIIHRIGDDGTTSSAFTAIWENHLRMFEPWSELHPYVRYIVHRNDE